MPVPSNWSMAIRSNGSVKSILLYLDALVAVLDEVSICYGIELGGILSEDGSIRLVEEVPCIGGFRDEFIPCLFAASEGCVAWD